MHLLLILCFRSEIKTSGSDHELQGQQEAAYTRESFSILLQIFISIIS